MLKTSPFVLFDGECAEAMEFYKECLGGELTLMKLGDTPMKDQFPPEKHNRVIYAQLKNGDIDISATDWMSPDLTPKPGNTMSIYVVGADFDALKPAFDKLSKGCKTDGVTFQDLHQQPFGTYGQLTDKYGVAWIFKGDK